MRKPIPVLLGLLLVACQPMPQAQAPAMVAPVAGRLQVRLTLPQPLRTQAAVSDIHHLRLTLHNAGNPDAIASSTRVTAPLTGTITASMPMVSNGTYLLKVEAFASSDETASITEGGPLASANTAEVKGGVVTYAAGDSFTFATPLPLVSGATWYGTVKGPLSNATYELTITNPVTGEVMATHQNGTGTFVARHLPAGQYEAWASVADNAYRSVPARPFPVDVAAGSVVGPASWTLTGSLALIAGVPGASDQADHDVTDPLVAKFQNPTSVAVDGQGNVYIADKTNHCLRKLTKSGDSYTLSSIAGTGVEGTSDGGGDPLQAQFKYPSGVAVDKDGNLYVTDDSMRVRKLTKAGDSYTLSTIAGNGNTGHPNGGTDPLQQAFTYPTGITVDKDGHVYFVASQCVFRLTPDGGGYTLSTLAGSPGASDFADGPPDSARFADPMGVAVDAAGNLYVTDKANHRIRKLTKDAGYEVSTLAGTGDSTFTNHEDPTQAKLHHPEGIAVDALGNVYWTEIGSDRVRRLTKTGSGYAISTVAGSGTRGYGDGGGSALAANFFEPTGAAVDKAGNVYIADQKNHVVRVIR